MKTLPKHLQDEMGQLQRKAWELLKKMEKDPRGAIAAIREARECVESLSKRIDQLGELPQSEGGR